jgi:pyruvate-ferredoxin/flavodoxin oxidoreductase
LSRVRQKGEKVVNMNYAAIDNAISSLHKVEVPKSWANAKDAPPQPQSQS